MRMGNDIKIVGPFGAAFDNTKPFFAEFIGTFSIVFFGCGAQMTTEVFQKLFTPLGVPMAFGLAVGIMIYAVGRVSGAHFNPAVTLGLYVGGNFPFRDVVPYWAAQFLGSIIAMAVLIAMLPGGSSFGATVPSVPVLAALVWEVTLTFFLVLVIMAVTLDRTVTWGGAGTAIGGMVTLCSIVGGGATGASMNPARTLGPALAGWEFSSLWLYFVGPCAGAVSAAVFDRWIVTNKQGVGRGAYL